MKLHLELLHSHARLVASVLMGGLIAIVMTYQRGDVGRLLIEWNVAVWTYVALVAWIIGEQASLQPLNWQSAKKPTRF